jgi:hypothetical protein
VDRPESEPLLCPLCEYDLRGSIEPRCSECGYAFTWDEIRDPARRLHPYAFEHHPERNGWSFRRTLFAGLRPGRFWRTLFPTQPSRPRRLVVYWLIGSLVMTLPLVAQYARQAIRYQSEANKWRAQTSTMTTAQLDDYAPFIRQMYGTLEAYNAVAYPLWPSWDAASMTWQHMRYYNWATTWALIVLASWPWLTFAALMVFQVSMRRVRLRPIHVLRCVVHASDVVIWLALAMLIAIGVEMYRDNAIAVRQYGWAPANIFLVRAMPFVLLLLLVRVAFAYRLYLRFRHAVAVAIASQVIVWLILAKLTLDVRFFQLY